MKAKRIFLLVIDSVGCGECEDSHKFGDIGVNTIKHISSYCDGISLPTMERLGYGHLTDIIGVSNNNKTIGYFAKARESSNGKDTMTGHWEMMGVLTKKPFITFTDTGFPKELIEELERQTGRKVIGNISASGTEIIEKLGEEQRKTGALIVYTSADSVLQIAADENVIPLEELYKDCEIARRLTLKDSWRVGRIIARPYIYHDGVYTRTTNRHDYALDPSEETTLNVLNENGYRVISVGKINDIFNGNGIDEANHITSNHNGMEITINIAKTRDFTGLCFINLVDFDALYGHRRDPKGYHDSLCEFDSDLKALIDALNHDDLLIVTADHGNDPTYKGSDHTREFVPVLVYSKSFNESGNLGIIDSFASIGATIAENFNIKTPKIGTSFLNKLK